MPDDEPARPPFQFRFHRLAEQVADHLRERILSGELPDGSLLPKEDQLRSEYAVSKPSLREAMRILESEGVLSVRRGNAGGAIVHRPESYSVAYALALVLRSRHTKIADVAAGLLEVEPSCAALCALRRDRKRAVVPVLRRHLRDGERSVDDIVEMMAASRRFHEAVVELCGNETLIVMAGALEALWSVYERNWSQRPGAEERVSTEERRRVLGDHKALIEAIEAGDPHRARELSAAHLLSNQQETGTDGNVDPIAVREHQRLASPVRAPRL